MVTNRKRYVREIDVGTVGAGGASRAIPCEEADYLHVFAGNTGLVLQASPDGGSTWRDLTTFGARGVHPVDCLPRLVRLQNPTGGAIGADVEIRKRISAMNGVARRPSTLTDLGSINAGGNSAAVDTIAADCIIVHAADALKLEASPDGTTDWKDVIGVSINGASAVVVNPVPRFVRLANGGASPVAAWIEQRRSIG